ncbi:MAG: ribosome maturation factor RimP, partial [Thermoanaerobaculia bacterium]
AKARMPQTHLEPRLEEELRQLSQHSGCELLHCEFVGGALRLYLDRPEGVTLEDCQTVSKQVSALLDAHDFGAGRYLLEVSSPGLNRRFYRSDDYQRFLGRSVRITWKDPTMETTKTVVGRLESYRPSGHHGEVKVIDSSESRDYTISLKNIQLARLEPEF